MTSRPAKAGQTDQRKVYLNWANHYLRKSGSDSTPLSDLKEIADGLSLPRVLKAVVQESVPGIHVDVGTEEQRRENIDKCIEFLNKFGVNCSSFSSKDLCDGKDRAVLALFYSLSQYKRSPSSSSQAPNTNQQAAHKGSALPSRIARPVSPGLVKSHGVAQNGTPSSHPATSPNPAHLPSPNPAPSAGQKEFSSSLSVHSGSPPATSPISPHAPHRSLSGPRRTFGSSIMTTTFDRPFMHRKGAGQHKPQGEGPKPEDGSGDKGSEGAKQNGGTVELVESSETTEVKSDPETEGGGCHTPKQTRGSRLTKHSSFSFGHGTHSAKDSRLHKPAASKGTTTAEEAESATPPSQTKLRSLSGSKLQMPTHKNKEPASSASSGDAPEEQAANEPHRPPSRLKFLGSGRSTPSNATRSGIQRPSSRLSKKASSSTNNLSEGGGGEDTPPTGTKGEKGSGLRLQRKGSDGAVKKHLVNTAALKSPIQSGTSSLPRHLPKGMLAAHAGEGEGEEEKEKHSPEATEDKHKTAHAQGEPATHKDLGSRLPSKGQGLGDGVGLRRPGGLKKPGSGLMSLGGGVRTPNLPSSGPQSSNTNEGEETQRDHTPPSNHAPPSSTGSPGLGGKKLLQPKSSGLSKLSGLKRPTSPSTKHRLHRITPATAGDSPKAERKASPAPPSMRERESSEKADVHVPSPALEQTPSKGQEEGEMVCPDKQPAPKPVQAIPSEREVTNIAPEPSSEPTPSSADSADHIKVPESVSESVNEVGVANHLRFGRRISPEGMSHEEITSPKVETSSSPAHKESATPLQSPSKQMEHVTPPNNAESAAITEPEPTPTVTHEQSQEEPRPSRYQNAMSAEASKVQRARSLSPKSPYRLVPKGMARVKDLDAGVAGALIRAHSSDSTSSEGGTPTQGKKPLKSSLHQKRGGSKSRHSSSSSVEGVASSPASSGMRQPKVTISPRSSQFMYDPDETLHPPPHPSHALLSSKFLSPGAASSERPSSFASMDSSTTSDSLSPSNSTSALFQRGVARRSSLRSTLSEQLEYRGGGGGPQFMSPVPPGGDMVGSTPELIESFENQLTNMKAELTDKDRMLSMYETSMADLSTKMHMLKKSLEEKDNAIRHLTEKQTTQSWYDLEGHSLMTARANSAMGGADQDALSDGYLSDSMLEEGKEKSKKKKAWKNPFRSKKKDGSTVSQGEQLSPNMDTESVISGRTAKSLKRSFAKKKAPDLMSISEYPPEGRFKDADAKSTYTMDLRSEYGGPGHMLPLWEDDPVRVYDDPEPGTRAEVILFIDTNETKSPANDSGYYGDLFGGRHGNSKWRPDSIASSTSSDSGHHSEESNEQFVLGTLSIPPELSWVGMDTKIAEIFHHHLNNIDPESSLGLTEDSINCYMVGEERRQVGNALLPPVTPYQALANKLTIKIYMKGAGQQACDSLAYKTLMGTESLQSYMSMLHDTQWLVVMGTKGTCKSSLVSGVAQHLSCCLEVEEGEGMEDLVMGVVGGEIIRFNLDKDGVATILKYFKVDLAKRVQLQLHPPIVVLEDVYECKDLEQILVAASALSRRPYIIAALSSGTTKGIPLHQLLFHHQIRVVTCNPKTDPVVGILARSLRKQIYQLKATAQSLDPVAERLVNWIPYLLNHLNAFINKFHSNVVNLGPRVFMTCPLGNSVHELENWFLNLWNHFIIPYLMGTIMAGIETYTADPLLEWVDVREWVVETYPWPSAINVSKLRTLNPDDVGWNHAVRPHQNRYIMYKDDDTRSVLHADTQSIIH